MNLDRVAASVASPGNDSKRALANGCFYVSMNDMTLVFLEASGMKFETDVMPYEEGGVNDRVHRLPGRTKSGNLVLKRGIAPTQQYARWYQKIISGHIDRQHVTVEMRDMNGNKIVKWDFYNAYPVVWSGPSFVAGEATLAVESLELAHDGVFNVS